MSTIQVDFVWWSNKFYLLRRVNICCAHKLLNIQKEVN